MPRNFTKQELDAADEARRLHVIVSRPSKKTFEDILQHGWIMNNPVTVTDFHNALSNDGEDLGVLIGKNMRKMTTHVKIETETVTKVAAHDVMLSIDLMYILGLTFLVTVRRNICFIFSSMLTDQKKSTVINALKQVMRLHCGKGHDIESVAFKAQNNPVHMIQADNELHAMKEKLKTEGVIQVSKHCHER